MRRFAFVFLVATFALATPALPQDSPVTPRPVLIQGALQLETTRLVGNLKDAKIERVGVWTFWRGTVDSYPVIVSRTRMGASHAAAATALAIERYRPIAIVNQGTAGGHDPALRVYDIMLGTSAVNLGAFKTHHRAAGMGSTTLDWVPLDLMESDGGPDDDLHEHRIARFEGDTSLLAAARRVKHQYARGRVVEGVIGTSDVWNEEIDRIARLRASYGTSVEEMETAAAAQIAGLFNVSFLGIRVVSANITSGGAYDPKTGEACQDYVFKVVRAYVANIKH